MKCPNPDCPSDMDKIEQETLWCPTCGAVSDREGEHYGLPTQAKSHAALREALSEAVIYMPFGSRVRLRAESALALDKKEMP